MPPSDSTFPIDSRCPWTRRRWLWASLGAGALALPATRARAQPPTQATPSGARVLILGDSMIAGAFGLFLARALERRMGATVERKGKSSSGLARPDFYDWLQVGPPIARAFKPDATIVMFGGNDCQPLREGNGDDAGWVAWRSEAWEKTYRRRVLEFCDRVAPVGTQLFWVGMPVMGHKRLHKKVEWINKLYTDVLANRAQSDFVDIWSVLANSKGEYTPRVKSGGKMIKARAGDGIHLTVKGAHHLVSNVAPRVAQAMGQTLQPPAPRGRRSTKRG